MSETQASSASSPTSKKSPVLAAPECFWNPPLPLQTLGCPGSGLIASAWKIRPASLSLASQPRMPAATTWAPSMLLQVKMVSRSLALVSSFLSPLLDELPFASQDSAWKSALGSPLDPQRGPLPPLGSLAPSQTSPTVLQCLFRVCLHGQAPGRWPDEMKTAPQRAGGGSY